MIRCLGAVLLVLTACGSVPATVDADVVAAADLGVVDLATMPDAAPPAVCGAKTKSGGQYCGNDGIDFSLPGTLYTCAGPGLPPQHTVVCASGCTVEPAGVQDHCVTPVSPAGYRLPWTHGTSMQLTQDCNDSCCADHVGNDEYAWDFANGASFTVRAARAGTITHLKLSSTTGCATTACSADANLIAVDHGDGTQAVYLHFTGMSAAPGIACGASVAQGQALAMSGTTGHSTGIHLHFQVEPIHANVSTCECDASGLGCAADWNPYGNVWVDSTHQTLPIVFEEWPAASTCADRRITMPNSLN